MPLIIIQSAGLLTTVQDMGRTGYQRYGMPVAGAMDTFSLQLANLLVGNKLSDACLETTLTGPEILFTESGAIAICGADMGPLKNGNHIQLNKTIKVKSGDILSFEGLINGCRSYIAFAGGIDVPLKMGSRSTYLRAKFGGFEGRGLLAGDVLSIGGVTGKIRVIDIPEEVILLRVLKYSNLNLMVSNISFHQNTLFPIRATVWVTDFPDSLSSTCQGMLILFLQEYLLEQYRYPGMDYQ
jgi:biotin-dependent carboxylase-like uncharacterized protein